MFRYVIKAINPATGSAMPNDLKTPADDDQAEARTKTAPDIESEKPDAKRQKRSGGKQNKGKDRVMPVVRDTFQLCHTLARGQPCPMEEGKCRWSHDVRGMIAAKPDDVRLPPLGQWSDYISESPPFVKLGANDPVRCPIYDVNKSCRFGLRCRFLAAHIEHVPTGEGIGGSDVALVGSVEDPHMNLVGVERDHLRQLSKRQV